jgi:hypothetical protein
LKLRQGDLWVAKHHQQIGMSKPKSSGAEADKLSYGKQREAIERNARQLEIASHINEWVHSPAYSHQSSGRQNAAGRP